MDIGSLAEKFGTYAAPTNVQGQYWAPSTKATLAPQNQGFSLGQLPGDVAHLAGSIGSGIVHSVTDGFTGMYGQITGNDLTPQIDHLNGLTKQQDALGKAYKTGQISKADYSKGLKSLQGQFASASQGFHQYNQDYRKNFAKNEGKAGLAIATILAPAVGGEGLLARAGMAADRTIAGISKPLTEAANLARMKQLAEMPAVDSIAPVAKAAEAAPKVLGATDGLSEAVSPVTKLAVKGGAEPVPVKIAPAIKPTVPMNDIKNVVPTLGASTAVDGLAPTVSTSVAHQIVRSLAEEFAPVDGLTGAGQAAARTTGQVDHLSQAIDTAVHVLVNEQKIPVNLGTPGLSAATKLAILRRVSPELAAQAEKSLPSEVVNMAAHLPQKLLDGVGQLLGVGKTISANPVLALGGKVVRNYALVQPTAQFAGKTVEDFRKGDVPAAALDTVLWGVPGIVKIAGPMVKDAAGAAGERIFGKPAILNEIFGPDAVKQFIKEGGDINDLKQIEQFTLNQKAVGGDVQRAGGWLRSYINSKIPGIEQGKEGLSQLVNNFKPYAEEMMKLQENQAKGIDTNLTVSHNFTAAVPGAEAMIDQAAKGSDFQNLKVRLDVANAVIQHLGLADDTLNRQIGNAIVSGQTVEDIKANLHQLVEEAQKNIVKDLGNGFVLTYAPNEVAIMPTAEDVARNEVIKGSKPSAVGNAITKAGFSPRSVGEGAYQASLSDALDQRFAANGVKAGSGQVFKVLQGKMDMLGRGMSDVRQLSNKQVEEALRPQFPDLNPKIVRKSIRQAYADMPASVVGGGAKVVNRVMNPLLGKYLQTVNRFHFESNPLFYGIKVPMKSGLVAYAEGANVAKMAKPSREALNALSGDTEGKWFSSSGRSGGSGTVTDELGTSLSVGGQEVRKPIRNMIAGLAESVAEAHGTTVKDIVKERGPLYHQLQEATGLVKGYGTGGYLNSPLAKTLNLIIFPSRFDTKVAMEVGKIFAKAPVGAQVGAVASVAHLQGFLSSPEGKQWQQENADMIGLLKYFTPLETIEGVTKFFADGMHMQDLGLIGGLPFGVITTILDHQGLLGGHLGSSQYVDPKTGKPVPSKIPTTDKARFQQGMTDLIGSLFSYPGQTAGLTSKTKVIQGAIPALKEEPGTYEYRLADGSLAPSNKVFATPKSPQVPAVETKLPEPHLAPITPRSASGSRGGRTKKIVPASMRLPQLP